MFNKLFGGGKKDKPKEPKVNIDDTIKTLDQKLSDLELLTQNLDVRQKNLQEEAKKKLKAGDKEGAKRLLVKKKKLLDQLKQTEGAMTMMEEQKMQLESAGATKEIVDTLKTTNQIVKEAMKELNIESLEELKEQMEEIKEKQNEINNFFADYVDEQNDDLEDELNALEKEEAQKNAMPAANKEKIHVEEKNKVKNEDEFNLDQFLNS